MPNSPLRSLSRLAAASALATLALAAPAQADSIAYVKGGDLWLSTPDGARQYQVTNTGGYSTVSQSDYGKLVALHGDRIRTLDLQGNVLHDIRTPASSTMPGTQFRGPFDPAVSPNGMKIAYTWYYTETGENSNCNPSTGCQTVYGRQGTGYTRPDRITGFDEYGFQSQSGWVGPSWHDDGETLITDPIQVGNPQVAVHTPGDEYNQMKGGMSTWFNNSEADGLRDGEMTRDKKKVAFITGDANELIHIYRANGGHPNMPTACYQVADGKGRYQQPSWSPDGSRLAFADDTGILTIPVPDFSRDCGKATEDAKLLIPGASYPDWGRSDVPPARAVNPGPNPGNPGNPGPGPGPSPQKPGPDPQIKPGTNPQGNGSADGPNAGKDAAGTTVRVTVAKGALRSVLRRGLVLKLAGAEPGTAKLTARSGRTVVASGRTRVSASGTGKVTLRFTKSARRKLAGKRSVKLAVRGAGVSTTITLKR